MSNFGMCSHCLRALRQSVRAELNATGARRQNTTNTRFFSTSSTRWQQQASQRAPSMQVKQPIMPPTTASTVTSNIAATPPLHSELESLMPSQPQQDATIPPSPPTTTSTIASNITASQSSSTPQATQGKSHVQPASPKEVSQMQHQIQSSLTASPSKFNLPARIASSLKKNVPSMTKTYTIYGQTEVLFSTCAAQADYTIPKDVRMNILTGKGPVKEASQEGAELGQPLPENKDVWWFNGLNLPPTFSTWSQVTFLHMYVITTKLRSSLDSEPEFQNYHRYLIEHFSRAAEDKMVLLHNLNAQGIRSRYLKDLLLQWRGILVSYDEGLVRGDAVLASAIWRNLFRADENVDWVKVAQVVAFLRLTMSRVGGMSVDQVLQSLAEKQSIWPSGTGQSITQLVDRPSRALNESPAV